MRALIVTLFLALASPCLMPLATQAEAQPLAPEALKAHVQPPLLLGEKLNEKGVYSLHNVFGGEAGFVFETQSLAPLPGFSGAPVNVLVMLDLEGRFIEVKLLDHNEPIFVSGLPNEQFEKFFEQYRGHSIADPIAIGTPYGESGGAGSSLVYLDGVTKATASVRIAHESILAAALAVAREKMHGVSTGPPARPDMENDETLNWEDLVAAGIATRHLFTNARIDELFAGTLWEDDDPIGLTDPNGANVDLWIVDVGPPAIARAVLSSQTLGELNDFMQIATEDEPILLIEAGRHGLVAEDFVRNTAPDWISAQQDGFPVALRDADLFVETAPGVPPGTAMILRTDRRLGFNPAREWELRLEVLRQHGSFHPEVGSITVTAQHVTPARFFTVPEMPRQLPAWQEAIVNRSTDLILLASGLVLLTALLYFRQSALAGLRFFTHIRLGILALVIVFVGWWGQGQLSIVTPLALLRSAVEGGSPAFLLYDPFSLLIWGGTIIGFVLWGRGLFCGWLCPFGALQEFAHYTGRLLRLPQVIPSARWDARLKWLKYVAFAGLVSVVFIAPDQLDAAAEIEPFKTAITTFFIREWYYVIYAVAWLLLATVLFKGFCRYVCPLGALMAIGGLFRGRDWIPRRTDCGSPCQLCRVRCNYGAIARDGRIQYDECFQCLDCVTIHDDPAQCVPLIVASRQAQRKGPPT